MARDDVFCVGILLRVKSGAFVLQVCSASVFGTWARIVFGGEDGDRELLAEWSKFAGEFCKFFADLRIKFWCVKVETLAVGRVQHDDGGGFSAEFGNLFCRVAEKVVKLRIDSRCCAGGDVCERATFHIVRDYADRFFRNIGGDNFLNRAGDCRSHFVPSQ